MGRKGHHCFEFLNSNCRLIVGRAVCIRDRVRVRIRARIRVMLSIWVRIRVKVRVRIRVSVRVKIMVRVLGVVPRMHLPPYKWYDGICKKQQQRACHM